MSEGQKLSQAEIDALLNGQSSDAHGDTDQISNYLSMIEADTLGEIGNISFGSAATALSELLNQKVEITTPTLALVERGRLNEEFPQPHLSVLVRYTEGFEGSNVLVIRLRDASIIANLMMGGDGTSPSEEIGEMEMSAVQEAMNQMMGSASTSMSTVFNMKVDISPPSADLMDLSAGREMQGIPDDDVLLKVSFNLKIGTLIDSNIMQLLPVKFARDMVAKLVGPGEEDAVPDDAIDYSGPGSAQIDETLEETQTIRAEPVENRIAEIEQLGPAASERQHLGSSSFQSRDIQSAVFSDFEETDEVASSSQNLNMLFDIPLQVTVELGRAKRTVKDILRLSPGSVIELDKLAGEPVDIYVNNKMIARGEVVVIDENFGVRVTEIASQRDRIQKIQ